MTKVNATAVIASAASMRSVNGAKSNLTDCLFLACQQDLQLTCQKQMFFSAVYIQIISACALPDFNLHDVLILERYHLRRVGKLTKAIQLEMYREWLIRKNRMTCYYSYHNI